MEELLVHYNIYETFPSLLFLVSILIQWPTLVNHVILMAGYLQKQTNSFS